MAVFLERVTPSFWETGQVKSLSSELILYDRSNNERRLSVGISDKASYGGMIVYQQNTFGNVFFLEFSGSGHAFRQLLALPLPSSPGGNSYGDLDLEGGRFKLKARYSPDAMGKGMLPRNPLLTLRLYEAGRLLGETTLMLNGTGQLGPYTVNLSDMGWWSDLLLDGSRGIPGVFAGFFLLLAGGALGYFVTPREVTLCRGSEGYSVSWRAVKFSDFYKEEAERIMAYCEVIE